MKSSQESEGSQQRFLNTIIGENIPVIIYLINSIQLRGSVKGFDTFTILLETPGRPDTLVYKSMVTSVVPMRPIRLYTSEEVTRGRNPEEPSKLGV